MGNVGVLAFGRCPFRASTSVPLPVPEELADSGIAQSLGPNRSTSLGVAHPGWRAFGSLEWRVGNFDVRPFIKPWLYIPPSQACSFKGPRPRRVDKSVDGVQFQYLCCPQYGVCIHAAFHDSMTCAPPQVVRAMVLEDALYSL